MKLNQQLLSRPRKNLFWPIVSVAFIAGFVSMIQGSAISNSLPLKRQPPNSETQFDSSPTGSDSAPCFVDFSSLHSFPQGTWVVDNSPWSFLSQTVSESQLERMMQDIPIGMDSIQGSSQPEHQAVLDLFPSTKAASRTDRGLTWRSMNLGTVRACVCLRSEANSVIHTTVAQRMHGDQWQVVRLTPNTHLKRQAVHLLPMLGDSRPQCQRFSDRGELQCEVINTNQSLDDLLVFWLANGWSVEEERADSDPKNLGWICMRGSQAVRVQATVSENKCDGLILTALHQLRKK